MDTGLTGLWIHLCQSYLKTDLKENEGAQHTHCLAT